MYKRRGLKKRQKGSRLREHPFSFPFGAIINFVAVVLLVMQRIMLANRIYDDANGYVNLALFVLLVIAMVTIMPIKKAEVRLIRSRIQKEQIKNIGKVLHVSVLLCGLINALISVVIYFSANRISNVFFGSDYCSMCIQYLSFFMLISGVASALMGYFEGNGKKNQILFTRVIYVLALILFSVLFSDGMMKYGANVAMFLHSNIFKNSYAASGAAFGILLAAFIDLVCLFVCFLFMKNSLRYEMKNDRKKYRETTNDIMKLLISSALTDILKYVLFVLPIFLSVLFLALVKKDSDNTALAELFGIFFGKYASLLFVPIAFSLLASERIQEVLWEAYHEKDIVKVRAICAGEMKLQAGFMALFISIFLCMAQPVCKLIFHYGDTDMTAGLLMKSTVLIFLYPLAITSFRLLLGIRRNSQAYISLTVAFFAQVVSAVICEFALHLELTGILISAIIFAACLLAMTLMFLSKYIRYHQEWIRSLLIPTVVSIVIGLLGRLIYIILDSPLGVNFSIVLSIILIVLVYGYFFFKVFRVKKKELQYLPGGNMLLALIEFLRL